MFEDLDTCPQDVRIFAETESVYWGKPGVTEQTLPGSDTRVFVFQGCDGCPLAVLRLYQNLIIDVAVARPTPIPDGCVWALLTRAKAEGAIEIQSSGLPLLRDMCDRLEIVWLNS